MNEEHVRNCSGNLTVWLFCLVSGGRSRLHLIDLGSCVKVLSKTRDSTTGLCLSLSALGNVILALVNGSKHIPYK